MPIVLKSGSLNLLEPSGALQACNGTALALPLKSEEKWSCGGHRHLWKDNVESLKTVRHALYLNFKVCWVLNGSHPVVLQPIKLFIKSKHNN